MDHLLPKSHRKWIPVVALLGAVAIGVALFLLVPLTQALAYLNKQTLVVREMNISSAPPPKTPLAPETEEVESEVTPPELQKTYQDLSLHQLELALSPGLGDALAMGSTSFALDTEIDVMEEIEKIFKFSDLESAPRLVSAPSVGFPAVLERRGVKKGRVELLIRINEKGRASVLAVVSSSHTELVSVAKHIVERGRFTISKIDGHAVQVVGNLPLPLEVH